MSRTCFVDSEGGPVRKGMAPAGGFNVASCLGGDPKVVRCFRSRGYLEVSIPRVDLFSSVFSRREFFGVHFKRGERCSQNETPT